MKKRRKPSAEPLEESIESVILDFLNAIPGIAAVKINTEGFYDPKIRAYRKRKSKHFRPGTSDILGCMRGRFFAIEVKSKKGVVSEDQTAFMEWIRLSGGITGVARSLVDAAELLGLTELLHPRSVPRPDGSCT